MKYLKLIILFPFFLGCSSGSLSKQALEKKWEKDEIQIYGKIIDSFFAKYPDPYKLKPLLIQSSTVDNEQLLQIVGNSKSKIQDLNEYSEFEKDNGNPFVLPSNIPIDYLEFEFLEKEIFDGKDARFFFKEMSDYLEYFVNDPIGIVFFSNPYIYQSSDQIKKAIVFAYIHEKYSKTHCAFFHAEKDRDNGTWKLNSFPMLGYIPIEN